MIYFAQFRRRQIKIGYSLNPNRRMKSLGIYSHVLIATMKGDKDMESKLHDQFRCSRVKGEYYRKDPALVRFIVENANMVMPSRPMHIRKKVKERVRNPTPTIPMIVNRRGGARVIQVRKEANEEIMQASLLKHNLIRLRITMQIGTGTGTYLGYQGSACFRDVKSIKEAREFERALRKFVEGEKS